MKGLYLVQKAGTGSTDWKTVCQSEDKEYAEKIYNKQLQYHAIGQFRFLDPDGKVIKEDKAMPLFS